MSRLTASPFHKPSPYEFPSAVHPLSPPDTDSEMGVPMEFNVIPGSNSVFVGAEFDNATNKPLQAETPAARFKRVSTLSYHSSGLRGPGERISQKASKSLVIVIPPDSLVQEHGQLGHNSLSSPQKRLAHGVLLPLLPTVGPILSKNIPDRPNTLLVICTIDRDCSGIQFSEHRRFVPVSIHIGGWDYIDSPNHG